MTPSSTKSFLHNLWAGLAVLLFGVVFVKPLGELWKNHPGVFVLVAILVLVGPATLILLLRGGLRFPRVWLREGSLKDYGFFGGGAKIRRTRSRWLAENTEYKGASPWGEEPVRDIMRCLDCTGIGWIDREDTSKACPHCSGRGKTLISSMDHPDSNMFII